MERTPEAREGFGAEAVEHGETHWRAPPGAAKIGRALSATVVMSDSERLERLEQVVARLAREMDSIKAQLGRIAPDSVRPTTPERAAAIAEPASGIAPLPPPATVSPSGEEPGASERLRAAAAVRRAAEQRSGADRRTRSVARGLDIESLVGRYGTLALAALTILMGVGAFLGWAIANGRIGPGARVALGAVAAAALAVTGWRLRARESKTFGNVLLALALALVHVDAWGAGPYLGLVPPAAALLLAAAASTALAMLALRDGEAALFAVGVGGALIAPFVTSSGAESALPLLAYGSIVLGSGMAALRDRAWSVPALILTLGCWAYTAAALDIAPAGSDWTTADLPAAFALLCAWLALALVTSSHRARIAQAALIALLGASFAEPIGRTRALDVIPFTAAGTLTAYATMRGGELSWRRALLSATVLPLGFLAAALAAAGDGHDVQATLLAVGWCALAVVAAQRMDARWRGLHLMTAGFASGVALLPLLHDRDVACIIALAVHAALLALVARRTRARHVLLPSACSLAGSTAWAFALLDGRTDFLYRPFLTNESLAAAMVCAAWLVFSWNASRTEEGSALEHPETRTVVRLLGGVVTFLWVRAELAEAISADVSTFLLIAYYAVVGVAAIFIGRARTIPALRHLGLAMSIYAALKAVVQASALAIGLRVGSYLLAGVFMLAVAYWYRARGASPTPGETELPETRAGAG